MRTKSETKQDTKALLLDAGTKLMLQKGYSNTGIQDILAAANVPKGCFYHHFESKEAFAVAIIHHFDNNYAAQVFELLSNPQRTPLQRLRDYCERSRAQLVAQQCRHGCLIGNLSQEMSDQSEVLRHELDLVMAKWRRGFTACIEEGQKAGEIKSTHSAQDLADIFYSAWNGAVMLAKTTKRTEPLDVFLNIMFEDLLTA